MLWISKELSKHVLQQFFLLVWMRCSRNLWLFFFSFLLVSCKVATRCCLYNWEELISISETQLIHEPQPQNSEELKLRLPCLPVIILGKNLIPNSNIPPPGFLAIQPDRHLKRSEKSMTWIIRIFRQLMMSPRTYYCEIEKLSC